MDEGDFLDFSFLFSEEDEEDDDYKPEEEEEEEDDGDDEEEVEDQVKGSQTQETVEEEEDKESTKVVVEADEVSMESTDASDLIAKRTRSKHQVDEVVDTMELFDIDPDLYDNSEPEDPEWASFCKNLFSRDISFLDADTAAGVLEEEEDDINDPEFLPDDFDEVVASTDHYVIRRERVVTWKEANSLDDNDTLLDLEPITMGEDTSKWAACFTQDHLKQLQDQLAIHVQLLTQSFLLCSERKTLISEAERCRQKILFFDSMCFKHSIIRIPNLSCAVKLVTFKTLSEVKHLLTNINWRRPVLSPTIRMTIVENQSIFICEELLPICGFFDQTRPNKATFTPNEDHLIAMGLETYTDDDAVWIGGWRHIRDNLVPTKTTDQIKVRVKNCRQRKGDDENDNPIRFFLKNGKLPETKRMSILDVKKTSLDPSKGPEWLRTELKRLNDGLKRSASPVKQANAIIKKYKRNLKPTNVPPKLYFDTPIETKEVNQEMETEKEDTEDKTPQEEKVLLQDESEQMEEQNAQKEGNVEENQKQVVQEKSCDEDEEDDESELAALMAASSTIPSTHRMRLKRETKKETEKKQRESTQRLLSTDWDKHDPDEELRQQTMVEHFMMKAREVLKEEQDFIDLLRLLADFQESRIKAKKNQTEPVSLQTVFKSLESFLKKVNGEKLIDELVPFLSLEEASECGKIFEYLVWRRHFSFVRKIEVLSADDPHLLSRYHKALAQIKGSITKSRIKTVVNKVLAGHPYLMTEFISLFMDEPPPYLMEEHDVDHVDMNQEVDTVLAAVIDPPSLKEESHFGTTKCPCSCHPTSTTHCIRCRLKVIDKTMHMILDPEGKRAVPVHFKVTCHEKNSEPSSHTPSSETSMDSWSKDDDMILLSFIQSKLSDNQDLETSVYEETAKQLNKTVDQISLRLVHLIRVLREGNGLPVSPNKH